MYTYLHFKTRILLFLKLNIFIFFCNLIYFNLFTRIIFLIKLSNIQISVDLCLKILFLRKRLDNTNIKYF